MDKLSLIKDSLDQALPETSEEIVHELRAAGLDPKAVGTCMERFARGLLDDNRTINCSVCGTIVMRDDAFASPRQFGEALLCRECAREVRDG